MGLYAPSRDKPVLAACVEVTQKRKSLLAAAGLYHRQPRTDFRMRNIREDSSMKKRAISLLLFLAGLAIGGLFLAYSPEVRLFWHRILM
jgi:hypothetical protein